MGGAVSPLPQYAFMVWCSVERSTGTTLPFPLPLRIGRRGEYVGLRERKWQREIITGRWGKLHNEELHIICILRQVLVR
jgi:hypothetical protein